MLTLNPRLKLTTAGKAAVRQRRETRLPGVTIEYCIPGNYERVARRLARAVYREFGVLPRLQGSRDGVFEVSVNGKLVFSKKATFRFPETDEIFYHLQNPPR
jgi:selT/selW/selH-like putative selenoprotein